MPGEVVESSDFEIFNTKPQATKSRDADKRACAAS